MHTTMWRLWMSLLILYGVQRFISKNHHITIDVLMSKDKNRNLLMKSRSRDDIYSNNEHGFSI